MSDKRQIEDILKEDGMYVSTTWGVSMYPMLRNRRDTIIVKPYEGRLEKYDVPLYKRGTNYILHRIIEVRPESYVIRGDNCIPKEYDINDEKILGVLTGFYRGSKYVDMNGWKYKCYSRVWVAIYPIRRVYKGVKNLVVRVLRKIKREVKKILK